MHFSVSLPQFSVFFPSIWVSLILSPLSSLFFFTLLAITPYLSPLYPYLFHLLIPSLLSIVSLTSDSIPYCFGFLFPFLSFIVHVFPLYPPFVFLPFILCLHPPIHNFIFLKLSTFLFPPLTALLLSYVSFVQVWAASNMSITCQFYCFFPPWPQFCFVLNCYSFFLLYLLDFCTA